VDILELKVATAGRLDKALAACVPEGITLSRSRIQALIEGGQVRDASGKVMSDMKAKVAPEAVFHVEMPEPEEWDVLPQDIPLDVVFEDEHLLVINKPVGMVVHPAPGSPDQTLVNAVLFHAGDSLSGIGGEKRPGIVHRIDKDTSGLLVVAKSDAAHQGLAKQFADHSIERIYYALCHGVPSAADPRVMGLPAVAAENGGVLRITAPLARHKHDRKRQTVVKSGGRHAVTRLKVLEDYGIGAMVSCQLETGRTHQIRVHMSHVGHALVGDAVYGKARKLRLDGAVVSFPRQALHAAVLGFTHPITKARVRYETPLKEKLTVLLECIGKVA